MYYNLDVDALLASVSSLRLPAAEQGMSGGAQNLARAPVVSVKVHDVAFSVARHEFARTTVGRGDAGVQGREGPRVGQEVA